MRDPHKAVWLHSILWGRASGSALVNGEYLAPSG